MSDIDLTPLDEDVRALVEGARGTQAPPAGVKLRVLARVEAIVLPPLGGPGGGGGGDGGGAAGAQAGQGASIASQIGWARRALPLVASFLVGGAAGAVAMRVATPPPAPIVLDAPRVVYVDRPAPSASASPAASTPAVEVARGVPSAASSGTQGGVAAERALLDVARGALEREDGAAALAATREHERRFPAGMLVQEREAMAVRALVMLGRTGEARARAERFRARFPNSVLLPALESAVGAAPSTSP
ncbi:MAG TPA: hypothetical protein VIF15_01945 [Polyangiaceae bacterium]|jgi:hypothetical protein